MGEIKLTKQERLSYSLQLKILEKLTGDDSYKNLITMLEEGYTLHYQDLFELLYNDLSIEDCRFVLDVLEMYRGLNFSANSLGDKKLLEEIQFKGFDFNDSLEGKMASYARYFVFDLQRYDEIRDNSNGDFSSHMVMRNKYKAMLKIWNGYEFSAKYMLSKENIELILKA